MPGAQLLRERLDVHWRDQSLIEQLAVGSDDRVTQRRAPRPTATAVARHTCTGARNAPTDVARAEPRSQRSVDQDRHHGSLAAFGVYAVSRPGTPYQQRDHRDSVALSPG